MQQILQNVTLRSW